MKRTLLSSGNYKGSLQINAAGLMSGVSAVGDLGQAWKKVKDRVGRSAPDCRDRWRNHLVGRSERQRGTVFKIPE